MHLKSIPCLLLALSVTAITGTNKYDQVSVEHLLVFLSKTENQSKAITDLLALFLAHKERVFADYNVSGTLQLVTTIGRNVELDDVVNCQRIVTHLVTVAKRNLNWPEQTMTISAAYSVFRLQKDVRELIPFVTFDLATIWQTHLSHPFITDLT